MLSLAQANAPSPIGSERYHVVARSSLPRPLLRSISRRERDACPSSLPPAYPPLRLARGEGGSIACASDSRGGKATPSFRSRRRVRLMQSNPSLRLARDLRSISARGGRGRQQQGEVGKCIRLEPACRIIGSPGRCECSTSASRPSPLPIWLASARARIARTHYPSMA